jgi:hypothetical protein
MSNTCARTFALNEGYMMKFGDTPKECSRRESAFRRAKSKTPFFADYVEALAEEMEERMKKGGRVRDVADEAFEAVDADDLSFTERLHAIRLLNDCWFHGPSLQKWAIDQLK